MATKSKKQSLADKISNIINVAPTNFGSDDDEAEETKAKIVEQFDGSESDDSTDFIAPSSIRKQNVDLLDEIDNRYRGKKVSKKDIYENDSNDDSEQQLEEDSEDDDDNDNDENSIQSDNEESDLEGNNDAEEDDDDDDDDDVEGEESDSDDNECDDKNPLYRNREDNKYLKNITINNPRDDIEKGNCVREQLRIWENLLEMRIQLQKCLVSSNKLPQYTSHKEYESSKEFVKSKNQTKNKLMDLLENMLEIQDKLLKNHPETKKLTSELQNDSNNEDDTAENDPMDEEICSDTDEEIEKNEKNIEEQHSDTEELNEPVKKKRKTLTGYEKILSENHKKFIPYRNSVIQLWNDKTRIASGNMNKGTNQSIIRQIEFILNDKFKIIRKTQLKRSEYKIIGKTNNAEANDTDNVRRNQEYDPEIYDDDDFYHQLLRELIQHKSADVTDPIQLSRQWALLQSMRNKMKRKVNTKESKGRRIRYGQIHNKLVNFMAPITINDTWSSQAKTELYNSLFGKIKSVDINTSNQNVINNN